MNKKILGVDMAKIPQPSLFSWNAIEAKSDLERFYLVRDNLPDEQIVMTLERNRGNGRDDFPVRAMWNAVLAGIVFQHESIESLIRELSRNPSLLEACGFDPTPITKQPEARLERDEKTGKMKVIRSAAQAPYYQVPMSWNFSRFLKNVIELEDEQKMISEMVRRLRENLMAELPDFGKHLGYDGKAIDSHSTGRENRKTGQTSDPDANWGKHKTTGVDKDGNLWEKINSWFGYGLHLIADTVYEIPVAFSVTAASASEVVELGSLIQNSFEQTPALAERCEDFTADRGLDSGGIKAMLWDDYHIRPVIDIRELWREEKNEPGYDPEKPITRALFDERVDTIVHTEKGTLHCICPATGEQRDMAFQGFEANRNTLKYRCPAAAYGYECKGRNECAAFGQVNPSANGRIVRINITKADRRIFTPTPHGNPSWQRIYNRRSSLERINNRIDNSFGFEKHYIRGKAKMQTRVGLALAVMMAMALGHVRAGRIEQMRSLVRPIAKAKAA
jgi:hypothetical protein